MTMKKESDPEQNQKSSEQTSLDNALAQIAKLNEQMALLQITKTESKSGGLTPEDIANIAAIVAQTNKTLSKELNYEEGIQEEDIPADDWDEKGVRFCCPLVGYIINDDRRKGHRVKLPYNKPYVFFDYAATRKIQTGKYNQLAPLSVYRSHSKKEIEWLRAHTLYGIMFYESSTEAINVDASKAIRLANIIKMLQPLEMHDLFRRCKDYGIEISEDGPGMRGRIAVKILEAEFKKEEENAINTLNETYKSAQLLGRDK